MPVSLFFVFLFQFYGETRRFELLMNAFSNPSFLVRESEFFVDFQVSRISPQLVFKPRGLDNTANGGCVHYFMVSDTMESILARHAALSIAIEWLGWVVILCELCMM